MCLNQIYVPYTVTPLRRMLPSESPVLRNAEGKMRSWVVLTLLWCCRLTLRALERLRDDLVNAGVRCKRSKPHVVLSSVWHGCCFACCQSHRTWEDLERSFAPARDEATPGARDFLLKYARFSPLVISENAGRIVKLLL
jgi:hypothetical protein